MIGHRSRVGLAGKIGCTIGITVAALHADVTCLRDPFELSTADPAVQVSFEATVSDLSSTDPNVRLKSVALLKDAAYPEAAIPLARLITDPLDAVQLEAIAAELNIFLAEPIVTRRRVGFVLEKRKTITAETTFSAGPLAIGGKPVPVDVLTALRGAIQDDNPRVGLEAIYALGALAPTVGGAVRRDLLPVLGPELGARLGAADPFTRFAAARVIARVFARRPGDRPIDEAVGDALIAAINDKDRAVRAAAIQATGAIRYDRAVTALGELFTYHAKGEEAEAALDALAHIANPASAPLFGTQLTAKTPALRGIAVEGLARIGEPRRLQDIEIALKGERVDGVLLAVAFARTLLANAPIDPISEATTRPRTSDQAKQYLIEIAPARAGLFNRQVQDPDTRIRIAAVDALGLSGDPAALPLLRPMIADSDPAVAQAATRAVERLTAPR